MQIFPQEFYCPLCDEVMDVYADHALVCPCGGDRTKRHNLCRNESAHICASAALAPEIEKAGLLEPRLDDDALDNENLSNGRRPADIYIPNWDLGSPAALDFAITSGMRGDCLASSAEDGGSAARGYEERKRIHLQTDGQCRTQGFFSCL